jgi:putative ABC transport system permease protein
MSIDTWQEIFGTLRNNKLRAFLTACGVFWGVFMLIAMLGFGGGLERGVTNNMMGFATNAVYVWGQRTSLPHDGLQPGRRVSFETADIQMIRDNVDNIEYLAPRLQLGGWRGGNNVTRNGKTGDFNVNGDYPDFRHIQGMDFVRGRFVNDLDIENKRKVVAIGPRIYQTLYARGEDPIGSHLRIQGVYFTVVGQFVPRGSGRWTERLEQTVFIPFTTFQTAFNRGNQVGWFAATATPGVPARQLESDMRDALAKRHRIHPKDRQAMGSFNAGDRFGKATKLFWAIRILVWFVGICTLLAGVIGVSNIMLIIVKERTKEIGIRKAVGASPFSIVSQILQESTALTAIAGYFGLAFGVAVLHAASILAGEDNELMNNPGVDLRVAVIATLILIVSGAIAGIIPARNAVRVNPVQALRAE